MVAADERGRRLRGGPRPLQLVGPTAVLRRGGWRDPRRDEHLTVPAPYRLLVLAADEEWKNEVVGRCEGALLELLGRRDSFSIEDVVPAHGGAPGEASPQTLVVFLADDDGRYERALIDQLTAARDQVIPVLRVVRPEDDVFSVLPKIVEELNAVAWDGDGGRVVGHV